jgi:hypothetical protein
MAALRRTSAHDEEALLPPEEAQAPRSTSGLRIPSNRGAGSRQTVRRARWPHLRNRSFSTGAPRGDIGHRGASILGLGREVGVYYAYLHTRPWSWAPVVAYR